MPRGLSVKGTESVPLNISAYLQWSITAFFGTAYPSADATSLATNQGSLPFNTTRIEPNSSLEKIDNRVPQARRED